MTIPRHEPNFDVLARPYRWLEYLTLGRTLEHTRLHFLPQLLHQHSALVLGDGDGRFLSTLLAVNPHLYAHAVDTSRAMLQLMTRRCQSNQTKSRLTTHHTSALTFTPVTPPDLIITHFFLDCFPQPEVEALTQRLAAHLTPGGLWLLSDFRIPPRGPSHLFARLFVRSLYAAFRLFTGLRTTHLPDHNAALTRAGLTRIAQHAFLRGLITTELWQDPNPRQT